LSLLLLAASPLLSFPSVPPSLPPSLPDCFQPASQQNQVVSSSLPSNHLKRIVPSLLIPLLLLLLLIEVFVVLLLLPLLLLPLH